MNITVKRAAAICSWDVFVNGNFVHRFDKKREAEEFKERMDKL